MHIDEKKGNAYKLLVEGDNLQAVIATQGKYLELCRYNLTVGHYWIGCIPDLQQSVRILIELDTK